MDIALWHQKFAYIHHCFHVFWRCVAPSLFKTGFSWLYYGLRSGFGRTAGNCITAWNVWCRGALDLLFLEFGQIIHQYSQSHRFLLNGAGAFGHVRQAGIVVSKKSFGKF